MPAIITRGFWRRKADWKGSEALGRKPAAITDELIVGFVQGRRVGGFNEWGRSLGPHPNNRLNPVFGFVWRTAYGQDQEARSPALIAIPRTQCIYRTTKGVVSQLEFVVEQSTGEKDPSAHRKAERAAA